MRAEVLVCRYVVDTSRRVSSCSSGKDRRDVSFAPPLDPYTPTPGENAPVVEPKLVDLPPEYVAVDGPGYGPCG